MARALLGHIGSATEQNLSFEVVRLRRRIAELQAEIAELRSANHVELDLELHRLAEDAEPALT
jgi:hypothetical protein